MVDSTAEDENHDFKSFRERRHKDQMTSIEVSLLKDGGSKVNVMLSFKTESAKQMDRR